ncbi:MAG: ParA family partition ATPase [Trueperaceae bacterium]
MKVLSIVSQKGGVGKSLLTVNLATTAANSKEKVFVIDLDPQASSANWGDLREEDNPTIQSAQHSRLPKVLESAKKAGATLVLIDTAPHSESAALAAIRAADYIIIPCRPSFFDIQSVATTIDLANISKKKASIVLNAVPPLGQMGDEAEEALKELGAEVAPTRIHQRVAFVHAQKNGQAAVEYDPEGKATQEVKDLYRWIKRRL